MNNAFFSLCLSAFICVCVSRTCLCLFQGMCVSDDMLKRTYLEPENLEKNDEMFRHPDINSKSCKHVQGVAINNETDDVIKF